MTWPGDWPVSGTLALRSITTVAAAWGIGHFLSILVMKRVAGWPLVQQHVWAHTAVRVVRERLPWWGLLVGLWLTAGYWPLTAEVRLLIDRALFLIGGMSVTFAAAAIASRVVDSYGAMLAPALPVSSLTRNIAWGMVAVLGMLVILPTRDLAVLVEVGVDYGCDLGHVERVVNEVIIKG